MPIKRTSFSRRKPLKTSSKQDTFARGTANRSVRTSNSREQQPPEVQIDALTHDGRGVARHQGRVLFVEGAVPGDKVKVRLTRESSKRLEGTIAKVLEPSPNRVTPPCPWYEKCGGCNQQHVEGNALLAMKQDIALGQLKRFADIEPEVLEAPLTSPHWGYRSRARLAVRWWNKQVKFGFRAAGSKEIVAIDYCGVLMPKLSELLPELRSLLENSENKRAVSHIELAAADNGHGVLLRTVQSLSENDLNAWLNFAHSKELHLYRQPEAEAESLTCLYAPDGCEALRYNLPGQECTLDFLPVDFTQVNPYINSQMVTQALDWLSLKAEDEVLDLFCGMGNFTLPLGRQCASVVGVEGVQALVDRGRDNARSNGLDNVSFAHADLAAEPGRRVWQGQKYDALLLDPPRTGALEILQQMVNGLPERILYVSCNPATLARDADFLREQGFKLSRFCVMDMFPQTTHVESMGLFVRDFRW